jgi:hypothetical protein
VNGADERNGLAAQVAELHRRMAIAEAAIDANREKGAATSERIAVTARDVAELRIDQNGLGQRLNDVEEKSLRRLHLSIGALIGAIAAGTAVVELLAR